MVSEVVRRGHSDCLPSNSLKPMNKVLSLQTLDVDETDAAGISLFSIGCNNNSKTSNCCTGGCTVEPTPEVEQA